MSASSTTGDQLRAASDAENALLPARRRVFGFTAPSPGNIAIDDFATRRAMANRRVRAAMIQVLAINPSTHLFHSITMPLSTDSIMDPASNCSLPLRVAPRAPHPRSVRVLPPSAHPLVLVFCDREGRGSYHVVARATGNTV